MLLNGNNYLSWSQSATFWLRSKAKFGYVNDTIKAPSPDDPTYAKWEVDNFLVMSWPTHSMEPEIAEVFLSMETTQDIYDILAGKNKHILARVF